MRPNFSSALARQQRQLARLRRGHRPPRRALPPRSALLFLVVGRRLDLLRIERRPWRSGRSGRRPPRRCASRPSRPCRRGRGSRAIVVGQARDRLDLTRRGFLLGAGSGIAAAASLTWLGEPRACTTTALVHRPLRRSRSRPGHARARSPAGSSRSATPARSATTTSSTASRQGHDRPRHVRADRRRPRPSRPGGASSSRTTSSASRSTRSAASVSRRRERSVGSISSPECSSRSSTA